MYGIREILVRTPMRLRTPTTEPWQFFSGTQDFNVYGHGRGATNWKLCNGGLNTTTMAQPYPCTTPGAAADTSPGDPAVRQSMTVPAYRFDDDQQYWSWLLWDCPLAGHTGNPYYAARTTSFMAYLPVAMDSSNQRTPLGFLHGAVTPSGFVQNYWAGLTTYRLPVSDTSCASPQLDGYSFMRPRVFMVTGVPYYDAMGHFGKRQWGTGCLGGLSGNGQDILNVSAGERVDVLVIAKESIAIGVEFYNQNNADYTDVPANYFSSTIRDLGGGFGTEVYAFAIDPRDPSRSLLLAGMNRTDPDCLGHPNAPYYDATHCNGAYNDDSVGSVSQFKYYHRRTDKGLTQGEVTTITPGIYHQLYCSY
ncbi:MAG TPA: hypothetical protein VK539_01330 [Myxococcaceae bacterium]|nr:hypothetical protein [Myxococcaceae bacterium]